LPGHINSSIIIAAKHTLYKNYTSGEREKTAVQMSRGPIMNVESVDKMPIDKPQLLPTLIIGVVNSTKKDGTLRRDGQNE
jgi:hypothetical protein